MNNEQIKLGVIVGFAYGDQAFKTDTKDPEKALREANKFIREKTGGTIELALTNPRQIRRRPVRHTV